MVRVAPLLWIPDGKRFARTESGMLRADQTKEKKKQGRIIWKVEIEHKKIACRPLLLTLNETQEPRCVSGLHSSSAVAFRADQTHCALGVLLMTSYLVNANVVATQWSMATEFRT